MNADAPARTDSQSRAKWEDWAVYGLILAGIYLLVGVLFFSFVQPTADLPPDLRAAAFGSALSVATIYNLAAVIASFIGFHLLTRAARG